MLVHDSYGRDVVCSAHAEVIRSLPWSRQALLGLLRTRGGDPFCAAFFTVAAKSAPHTRR